MREHVRRVGATALALMLISAVTSTPAEAAPICLGKPVTINLIKHPEKPSTSVADVILGTDGADTIDGLGGGDTICAGAGNDTVVGGKGNDTIAPNLGDDIVTGGEGFDVVSYADAPNTDPSKFLVVQLWKGVPQNTNDAGLDTLVDTFEGATGSLAEDNLVAAVGGSTIKGGAGDDSISGLLTGGDDILKGGAGDDTISPGVGTDKVTGGAGRDLLKFDLAEDPLAVFLEQRTAQDTGYGMKTLTDRFEALVGGKGNDFLVGTAEADEIFGGDGIDTLKGLARGDVLWGGAGDDSFKGGDGIDTCHGEDGMLDSALTCEVMTGVEVF